MWDLKLCLALLRGHLDPRGSHRRLSGQDRMIESIVPEALYPPP